MHRQNILRWIIAGALGMLVPGGAHAALCKYMDTNGHVTYSDSAVKGANKISCFEAPPVPPPAPAPRARAPGSAAPTAAPAGGLPNVDPATQRKRDDARRKILQDELAVEEKALEDARKALAEGKAVRLGSERNYQRYLDRIQGLEDRVTQHERNVTALKQELSNLR
jgi:hypothetical protein